MPKILIADDKNENRFVLKNFFKLFGNDYTIEIIEAGSAKESIELIEAHKPDLVLMDIKMESEFAGFDVVKHIRERSEYSSIIIWAITAHALEAHDSEASDQEKCLNAGFDDFISKPFDPVNLLLKTSKLLNMAIPENVKKKIGLIS
ncbi:MAG: hypothetical protein A2015_03780 [Spirochaetes bacterium GWF1_31_7]|nr:MAG: hypothetical protein A2Y30_06325 [Spirochaetes bacterium GWE1_32_154]OHD48830.1 MAG: hypothetical protein A2015_03780 [Spirochaetes bacterium GWF1_31_7]OHD78032.1 MAG: hypothetical protein A2355_18210 [Spirochaetes bacterium RIFOXYB1_FULL_32_8]HBD92646.1 hypothetical protein [Spirochaetia bacterium]HBI36865.1 hypothetical protein [Spirochaetia bacterium]